MYRQTIVESLSTSEGCVFTSECETIATLNTETFSKNNFNVYPNPFDSVFTIKLNQITDHVIVEVFDVNGRVIQSKKETNISELALNLENKSKGVYFLKITTGSASKIVKLIKQ